jgi:hypothetical protein
MQTICGYIANANNDGGHWACVELWDWYRWGGLESGGGKGTGTKPPQNTLNERTRGACGRMANEAQWAANKAIEQARVDPRSGNALGWFDSIFSEQYLGHPIATLRQGWDLESGTGLKGSKIDSFWRGSTGFQRRLQGQSMGKH